MVPRNQTITIASKGLQYPHFVLGEKGTHRSPKLLRDVAGRLDMTLGIHGRGKNSLHTEFALYYLFRKGPIKSLKTAAHCLCMRDFLKTIFQ